MRRILYIEIFHTWYGAEFAGTLLPQIDPTASPALLAVGLTSTSLCDFQASENQSHLFLLKIPLITTKYGYLCLDIIIIKQLKGRKFVSEQMALIAQTTAGKPSPIPGAKKRDFALSNAVKYNNASY